VTIVNPPSKVAIEEALKVVEAGVGGMTVTVTVTRAKTGVLIGGGEVGLEVLPVDMAVDGT
jgi:hypothetical protein